jgi:AcrR family transcriptional regulator
MARTTRDQKKAATRNALTRAAADVIARRGYHGASVDEIAESAGYTVGALYSHFERKQDLLLAAAEQNLADWTEIFANVFHEGATFADGGANVAHAWIEGVTARPEPFQLWVELWSQAVRTGPPLATELAVVTRAIRELFKTLMLESAETAGVEMSHEVADELGAMFDALGLGLAMRRLLDPAAVAPGLFERISVRTIEALFNALK